MSLNQKYWVKTQPDSLDGLIGYADDCTHCYADIPSSRLPAIGMQLTLVVLDLLHNGLSSFAQLRANLSVTPDLEGAANDTPPHVSTAGGGDEEHGHQRYTGERAIGCVDWATMPRSGAALSLIKIGLMYAI